ncbi:MULTISPECIES: SPOR domain-containing protein [unclassified Massilia]|uniref:SPOR domain-containing protein n=1 Tax=unclassified Massilia TaxID=2609279 RepID=UPI001781E768|nr:MULTISPECIES: SPOR domain-containing protein [unclassified Massilia]MBD8530609.1 SPOR domain-containing protein [Massilia sp. CFBP 13647]MBD8674833.1 SPOR domain-containing protein [Massilia sp. CFBP 13721]
MLRFVFWALLCANALVFAYGRGFLGSPDGDVREPARLRNQLAADRLVLLSGAEAQAIADAAAAADTAATTEAAAETVAAAEVPAAPEPAPSPAVPCVETDAFTAFEARRFETRLAALDLGARQTRLTVPFQEVSSYMVYLPPQGGKEGADRRTADLRERGVTNSFVMQGDSPMRWAISLGVFKSEAAARSEQARLAKQGVANVRILPRGPQSQRFAYRFRNIDTEIRSRIVDAGRGMAAAVLHICR